MNLNEFQNDENKNMNYVVDPNLVRKQQQGTQGYSTIVDPNLAPKKRKVTPQEMGFTHEEPVKLNRPEDPILDRMDLAIARKQNEARLMAQAIDESDGEGVSEEEFQDLLVQAKDELDDGIPTEEELRDQVMPSKSTITGLPVDNPTQDLMDELDAELEKDDAEYEAEFGNTYTTNKAEESNGYYTAESEVESNQKALGAAKEYVGAYDNATPFVSGLSTVEDEPTPTTHSTVATIDTTFKDFESGDINFDKEDEDLEENVDEQKLAEKEQKEQLDKLRTLVRQKISPVTKAFDISTFSVSKRPAANRISTPRDKANKIADWVLMSSQKPIYMKKFSGTELERLANGGKGRTRLNRALDTWQLIYNHIVDPHKPESLEDWAKATSFLDIDHIYMAIYRANFEGSNYIPYNCSNEHCKDKVFLSDNFDIMDMCKFADKEAKDKFNSIIGTEPNATSGLYSTEIVPVSDDYAFVFREPSIYNIIFESAVLDEEFVDKFGDLISICSYIDEIYYINKQEQILQPVRTNVYPNNLKKTVKSRIINFSKYISELDSDQYNTIIAYMQKINESGDKLTYQLPEVTCPACNTVIPAVKQDAQNLVFTRHQLAALATF